jgi:hypothetical protein
MIKKKRVITAPAFFNVLFKQGLFNSLLFRGGIALFCVWFAYFLTQISACRCEPMEKVLFFSTLFPEEMSLTYALNWVYAFLVAIVLESLMLSDFKLKPFGLLLAFLHNLPGALLILTFMSQPAYFLYYFTALLLSLPLLLLYRFFYDFQEMLPAR